MAEAATAALECPGSLTLLALEAGGGCSVVGWAWSRCRSAEGRRLTKLGQVAVLADGPRGDLPEPASTLYRLLPSWLIRRSSVVEP